MARKDYIGLIVFLLLILIMPFFIRNDYYLGILIFAAFNCIACIGLSLLMGYAGQISLGHAAFIAIGAFTSAILTTKLGWSPWLAMFAGVVLVVVVALIVGIPTLRLKGHYLGMATLGFGTIVYIVAIAATDLTGGPAGINNIPRLNFFGIELNTEIESFYFCWAVAFIGFFFAVNLINSRTGRALMAIHGSEEAAGITGINTTSLKIQIFIISAVYASIAGSLYSYYVNYIDPGPFGVMHSVLLVTMVAVGGMHNIWGAALGAVLLTVLPELLTYSGEYLDVIGIEYKTDYDILIYGGILLAIMLFLPEGLIQGLADLRRVSWRSILKLKERSR
jgi:branched-chain amino acid transport system permease protein